MIDCNTSEKIYAINPQRKKENVWAWSIVWTLQKHRIISIIGSSYDRIFAHCARNIIHIYIRYVRGYSIHMELFVLRIGNIQTVGYSWDFVPISEQVIGIRGWKGVHLCAMRAFVRDSVFSADLPSIASIAQCQSSNSEQFRLHSSAI